MLRKFDPDEVAELVAEVNGVPMSVLRTEEAMNAMEQQDQQSAAAATILQAAPVAAETARTLAQARRESQSVPEVVR